jgi:uncharacterized protein (DUF342 family)
MARNRGRDARRAGQQSFDEAFGAGAPTEPGHRRQSLADGPGWVEVRVSADDMRADIVSLSVESGDPAPVLEALQQSIGVVHGLDVDEVARLVRLSHQQGRPLQGGFAIARGTAPAGSAPDELLVRPPEPAATREDVQRWLESEDLSEFASTRLRPLLVVPGQPLVRRHGAPGRDVFGREVIEGTARLLAGEHVVTSADGLSAGTFGYLCLGSTLNVLPPLWISPDAMQARLLLVPQPAGLPALQAAWLESLLKQAGITAGIDAEAVAAATQHAMAEVPESLPLAVGRPPVAGVDAHLDFEVEIGKRAGTLLKDGSIDLRARNVAVAVVAEQVLARKVTATAGEPGVDLRGNELPASDGADREFVAGDNVRLQEGPEGATFIAEIDGAGSMKGDTLQVLPILTVSGDLGYETGNLESAGDIHISGNVQSGFQVKAGGSILVGGIVEDGAQLRAGVDIVVAKGVVGPGARVIARGNVEARFVQSSTVLAQGDMTIGSYLYDAVARAGGRIVVHAGSGKRSGSIVGGDVRAAGGIEAVFLGSPAGTRTEVGVGADPESEAELLRCRRTLETCGTQIARLLRTLGLSRPDGAQLKRLIAAASPQRRTLLLDAVRKLEELIGRREEAAGQEAALRAGLTEVLAAGKVRASKVAYPEVIVAFGERESRIAEELNGPLFYLTEEGLRFRTD